MWNAISRRYSNLYANLDGNQRRPTLEKIYHTDRFSWKRPSLWAA